MLRLHLRLRLRLRLLHMLTAPVEVRMQAGPHVIVGTLPGRETDRQEIEITDDTEVHLTLLPTTEEEQPDPPRQPSVLNYVIGGVGVGAGLAMMTGPLISKIRDGECESRCEDAAEWVEYDFGGQSRVLLVTGALLLTVGLVFIVGRPISVRANAGTTGARLTVESWF